MSNRIKQTLNVTLQFTVSSDEPIDPIEAFRLMYEKVRRSNAPYFVVEKQFLVDGEIVTVDHDMNTDYTILES